MAATIRLRHSSCLPRARDNEIGGGYEPAIAARWWRRHERCGVGAVAVRRHGRVAEQQSGTSESAVAQFGQAPRGRLARSARRHAVATRAVDIARGVAEKAQTQAQDEQQADGGARRRDCDCGRPRNAQATESCRQLKSSFFFFGFTKFTFFVSWASMARIATRRAPWRQRRRRRATRTQRRASR
jgi:hypothetical protein